MRPDTPRYHQIKTELLEKISTGELAVGEKLPGERRLATELHVSQMTANRAIQELVRDGYLRREVGVGTFVISTSARPKAIPRINIILYGDPSPNYINHDLYMGPLLRGVTEEGSRQGCEFAFIPATDSESLHSCISRIDKARDRILLIAPQAKWYAENPILSDLPVPRVSLGAHWEGLGIPAVDSDNRSGGQMAVEHLLQLGHRRIAMFATWMSHANSIHRVEGYRRALQKQEIPLDPELYVEIPPEEQFNLDACIRREVQRLLALPARPTAIFASGYSLALATIHVLESLGTKVPQEISVIGFDDTASAAFIRPALTTIRQPLVRMGEEAVRILLGEPPTAKIRLLPMELVVRGSTARPREEG